MLTKKYVQYLVLKLRNTILNFKLLLEKRNASERHIVAYTIIHVFVSVQNCVCL